MRSLGLALAYVLVLLVAAPAGAAPPAVTALKAATPPVLDGDLGDAVWQQGEWIGNFTLLGEGRKPATAQTRFKVAFDQQNLYFGAELFEPNMGSWWRRRPSATATSIATTCWRSWSSPTAAGSTTTTSP